MGLDRETAGALRTFPGLRGGGLQRRETGS